MTTAQRPGKKEMEIYYDNVLMLYMKYYNITKMETVIKMNIINSKSNTNITKKKL